MEGHKKSDGKMRGRRIISNNPVNSLRVVEGYFRKSMVGMYSKGILIKMTLNCRFGDF